MTAEDEDGAAADLVRAAVTELYAVPAAEFIPRRTELVKAARAAQAKDAATAIGALRKPSVAAWALNQVVRQRPAVLEQLDDVGVRLRHAQSALDAASIAGLRGERDAVLVALVAGAAEVSSESGQSLTAAVEAEVRDTGIAALADAAAAEAVASGGLTRALHYSGFGEVDVADAVARTSTGVVLTRIEGGGDGAAEPEPDAGSSDRDTEDDTEPGVGDGPEPGSSDKPEPGSSDEPDPAAELQTALTAAQERQGRAAKELSVCTSRLDQARSRSEATRARIEKLRADLAAAEAADEETLVEVSTAMQARTTAAAAEAEVTEQVERLQSALDDLA